jgi:hypothetical protein
MANAIQCPCCGEDISGDYMSADPQRRRFFAALRDVHENLPDHLRARWPNSEIMRKHALIAIGYCDAMTIACGSKAAAPGIAKAFEVKDNYCVAQVNGAVVTVFTARSMARRALLKKDFHSVADQVFAWIHQATGIDPAQSYSAKEAA